MKINWKVWICVVLSHMLGQISGMYDYGFFWVFSWGIVTGILAYIAAIETN